MTVYADILMLVNFVVDYFLLLLSAKFLHIKTKLIRLILSAAVGGVLSLYILLPQSKIFLQIFVHILMSSVLVFVAFGFKNIKCFCRNTATLFCVNFAYSGAMIAVWLTFKPHGMVINNSIVYFDISPIFLILFSVIGYFVAIVIRKIFKKPFLQNTHCEVSLFCGDKKRVLNGIADTGNSLEDVFGISQIFITDKDIIDALLENEKQNPTRFRKIPCNTVSGKALLDGYRIDGANVLFENKIYNFKNPILAVSQTTLSDAKIIVNPKNLN